MPTVLKTARLVLKTFSVTDARAFFELNADPAVLRFTGDVSFPSVAEAEDFIRNYDHYARYGFGRWSVFLKASGEYPGFCGLSYQPALDEVDVGFRFVRRHWGKGFASESARGAVLHGFRICGRAKIVGRARQENFASHRVLLKLGQRWAKSIVMDGHTWDQYEVSRAEALSTENSPLASRR